ncbi:MAG: hypothetical protein AB7S26_02020 [Sandaracinaceae bacterium]
MNHRPMNDRPNQQPFVTATVLLAAVICGVALSAAPAAAQTTQCQPDDLLCAEVRIGPGTAGVRIGGAPAPLPPPPPPVVVQPQPPTVYVQPMQPPPPPQPPVVVVQPAQPPPPPPQVVYQPPPPQPVVVRARQDRFPYSSFGAHLSAGGVFGDNLQMFGGGGAFRLRPVPFFALDIGANIYGGVDYNGLDRVQVPLEVDAIFFFNPQHRFQFYGLVGVGASFGHAEGFNQNLSRFDERDYFHLGGTVGVGVEWRISRWFALNVDVRGFIQQRVDDNPEPEFAEFSDSGTWQETDTSGGVTTRFGATFYFGR